MVLAKNELQKLLGEGMSDYPHLFARRCIFFSVRHAIKSGKISPKALNYLIEKSKSHINDITPTPFKTVSWVPAINMLIHAFRVYKPYKISNFLMGILKTAVLRVMSTKVFY